VNAQEEGDKKVFFVDGPAGTGKTYLYSTLMGHLRRQRKIVSYPMKDRLKPMSSESRPILSSKLFAKLRALHDIEVLQEEQTREKKQYHWLIMFI
jgi:pantothenate kinase-related protein Tda10